MIYEIITMIITIIAIILFCIGALLLIRYITIYFRLIGKISDDQAIKFNLPFSKNLKIKLDVTQKELK